MRKLLLGLAAGAILTLGASQPAEARIFFGFGFGGPMYYHHYHRFGGYCHLRTVRGKFRHHHHWVWRYYTQRVCY